MKTSLSKLRNVIRCMLKESSERVVRAYRSQGNTKSYLHYAEQGSLGPGYYFTTNKARAEKYSGMLRDIIEVDIALRNPLVGDKQTIGEQLGFTDHLEDGTYDFNVGKLINNLARDQGYDGIIARENNGKFDEVIAFDINAITIIDT